MIILILEHLIVIMIEHLQCELLMVSQEGNELKLNCIET